MIFASLGCMFVHDPVLTAYLCTYKNLCCFLFFGTSIAIPPNVSTVAYYIVIPHVF